MDDLKKKYEELKNKPENELDAFEQEALEGFEKTDLSKASITKKFYDAQFLNKYSSNKKFNLRILYFSSAALLLLALTVWLWRFYYLSDSKNELLSIKSDSRALEMPQPSLATELPEEHTVKEFKHQTSQDSHSKQNQKKSENNESSGLKNQTQKKEAAGMISDNTTVTAEPQTSLSEKEISGNKMNSTFAEEYRNQPANEMPPSSAPGGVVNSSSPKSFTRGKTEKNGIKITGDILIFEKTDNLIQELHQLSEKNNLNLIEVTVINKNEINIYIKEIKIEELSEALIKDLESVFRKNLLHQWKNKKILIKGN